MCRCLIYPVVLSNSRSRGYTYTRIRRRGGEMLECISAKDSRASGRVVTVLLRPSTSLFSSRRHALTPRARSTDLLIANIVHGCSVVGVDMMFAVGHNRALRCSLMP